MILIFRYLVPKGYTGISLFPFIILKNKQDVTNDTLINHEKIHLKQQAELFVIFFYLWYVLEFIMRLFQYKNWNMAYLNISFEREAYANELDLFYLKKRPKWAFFKYL